MIMQPLSLFLLLLIMGSSSFKSATAASERDALLGAMVAWKANFSSWVGDDPCRNWQGVMCDSDGRVTHLDLSNTGIIGPVPQDIATLQYLTVLDLSNPRYNAKPTLNAVSGDLSPLQALIHLQNLNVSFNNITLSSFPSAIFNLTSLVSLRIDNLRIGGPLPKELVKLTKLEYMYLANNSFTGPIPAEYGTLAHLREISLWNNNLNSKIPPEFGNLLNLTYLNIHECNLYGGLPPELGQCKKLQNISLYGNSLTGIVPDSWKNMTQLKLLWLHRNSLTKYLPEWLPSLPNLYNVSLDYNLFYGSVTNFPNSSVKYMSFTCNYFSGATPVGPSYLVLNTSGNCFDPVDNNKKIRCDQEYFDCDTYFSSLPNGSCPKCPSSQSVEDANTCVCTLSTAGAGGLTGGGVSNKGKLVGSIVGVGSLLLVLASILFLYSRYKKRAKRHRGYDSELWDGPEGIVRYKIQDIVSATDNFHSRHEIGIGGFGKVFHAVLEGREVAIKLAHTSSIQSTTGFRNEVVLLSRLHHINLVHLLGFCEAEGIQILVYEYMPNGNLHTMLFKSSFTLDWLTRLDIALGVAHGLEYLHSFADPPVIHRDVKPSNVLLDDNLVAKLSDFGISKVAPQEFEIEMPTRPAGTAGYIDPQYVLTEQLTTASDVYSFGMVLLELISGRKCIDRMRADGQNLVEWVSFKLQAEGLERVVDPRLGDRYPKKIYQNIVRLGLDCAAFKVGDRPSMKVVVTILDGCRWSVAPDLVELNHGESYQDHEQDDAVSWEASDQGTVKSIKGGDTHLQSNNTESVLFPR